jgi:glycosyltransferase involved in cell wall biosynthesis
VRIGFNLLHAMPEVGGVWNYISNLVEAVGREDPRNEYVAFVTEVSATLVTPRPNLRTVQLPIRSRVRAHRVLFENTALQALVRRERLDCLHWFANAQGILNAAPAVVTIYDLQPFFDYTPMSRAKRTFLRWRMRATARGAAMLLPMSQATAGDLQNFLGADSRRMMVIPPVLESAFQPPDAAATNRVRQRYGLPAEFWLYVAHGYAHKNHERLLQAYRAIRQENPDAWPLVLRGDRQPGSPELSELAARLGLREQVIVLPRLPREELPGLYGSASALVFPSLYEGAGIPVLEAQACGCPVVASDIAAIREFAADAVHYMNPHSVTDIKRAMMAIAAEPSTRQRLRRLGLERARAVKSIPMVDQLLAAYSKACQGKC